jgi:uncharacterized protein YcnI
VTRLALLCACALVLAAPAASAHVEVRPERAPAGDEARLTFEAENERTDAGTRALVIQMPPGVTSVKALSVRGWRSSVRGTAGARVTLTAPPGRELTGEPHGRFRLLVGLPRREGATLAFKVLQRYDDGQVVRWIGPAGSSEPAPTLKLTAAVAAPAPEAETDEPRTDTTPEQTTTEPASGQEQPSSDEDKGGDVPIWAGIGLIVLAALAGSALARRRNRRRLEEHDR